MATASRCSTTCQKKCGQATSTPRSTTSRCFPLDGPEALVDDTDYVEFAPAGN